MLGKAIAEFPVHQQKIIDKERAARSDVPKSNLLSTLVRLSDEERHASGKGGAQPAGSYLTEEELRGNLYLITVAGFDTTSNTLAYALLNIVVYPELQSWLYEEISQVSSDMSYAESFPKLRRCLALMVSVFPSFSNPASEPALMLQSQYETLRLYPPVVHSQRQTTNPTTLTSPTTNQIYHFPAKLNVYICTAIVSIDPSIWGPSALVFDPSRWLSPSGDFVDPPVKGSFVPWSSGPRACPGAKMSQVEFVSVFCEIVRGWHVEAVERAGETGEQARERLREVMVDSSPRITLQMNRPRDAVLRFVKR